MSNLRKELPSRKTRRRIKMADYVNLEGGGKEGYRTKFESHLAETEKEATKEKISFCRKCARLEFEDTVRMVTLDLQRKQGRVKGNEREFEKIKIDVGKYAEDSYFDLLGDAEIKEWTDRGGRTNRRYFMNYACKRYRHGVSIELTEEEYQKKLATAKARK